MKLHPVVFTGMRLDRHDEVMNDLSYLKIVVTEIECKFFCCTGDDLPLDWTLRHGRSAALSVALKEATPQVYTDDYKDKICRVLLAYLMADRVCCCIKVHGVD